MFARFLADYERELIDAVGEHEPHFFPFRRILFWGEATDGRVTPVYHAQ